MVKVRLSGWLALEEIEKGCSPSSNGFFQAVIQANWPGMNLKPLWPAGLTVRLQELLRSGVTLTTW